MVEGDRRRVRPAEVAASFAIRKTPADWRRKSSTPLAFPGDGTRPAASTAAQRSWRWRALAARGRRLALRSLLAVFGSNYFRPDWRSGSGGGPRAHGAGDSPAADPWAGVRCSIGSGAAADAGDRRRPCAAAGGRLDELPDRASLARCGDAWRRFARQTGLLAAAIPRLSACCPSAPAIARRGTICERRCEIDALGREARRRWMAGPPWRPCSDIAASRRLRPGGDDGGRVRILSAANALRAANSLVFPRRLSEKSFPSPSAKTAFTAMPSATTRRSRLPLVTRSQRSGEEMLLFYEAATRATRRLWLTYPAMDESAQPLSSSPYPKEVEQACGEGRIARIVRNDSNPVPTDDGPLSAAGVRLRATALALEGDVSLLAGLLPTWHSPPTPPEQPRPGCCMWRCGKSVGSSARPKECFPARRSPPWRSISPPSRIYGATELEQYAACPFRYFLARVLHVEPLEELALEIDYLERGRLAHEAMAAFHRRVNFLRGGPASPRHAGR